MEKSDSVERALLALAAALENQSKANLRQSEANLVQAGANKALAEAHKVAQERLAQRGDSPHATDRTDEEAVVGEE